MRARHYREFRSVTPLVPTVNTSVSRRILTFFASQETFSALTESTGAFPEGAPGYRYENQKRWKSAIFDCWPCDRLQHDSSMALVLTQTTSWVDTINEF